MRRNTTLMPVSMLCSGVIMVVLLLFGNGGTRASPTTQNTSYPPAQQTATAVAEATAAAAQANGPYPAGTGTSATQTGATAQATAIVTGTTTTPTTPAPTTPSTTTTATASSFMPATQQATGTTNNPVEPTIAATPTPTPDPNNLTCVPGETVPISGEGPPNSGFLLFFNKRIVSGGTVQSDGTFAITLEVGNERPGSYAVEVRVRGSQQLLAKRTCNVPATTPTPVVRRAGE